MKIFITIFLAALWLNTTAQQHHAESLFEKGQEQQGRGQYEKAIAHYNEALAQRPSYVDAYIARAAARAELQDFEGALTDYSIATELLPASYDAQIGKANVLFRLGRYGEAKDAYTKLLKLPPGETNMVYFQKSASASGTAQITTAQSDIRHIVFNYIGLTELKRENYKEAKAWLDSAISLRPANADVYVNRGLVREKLGDKNAREDFEKALKLDPQHTAALTALGRKNAKAPKNQKDPEATFLDQAIESDPNAVQPYLERAYERMSESNFQGALQDYNKALQLDKRNPETWLNRGYVKEKLNDLKGAYADYTQAISLKENYHQAWLNRGNVLQKQGRLTEALEDYTVAITYQPAYGSAFHNRAVVLQKLKRFSESCDDVSKAESLGVTVDKKLKALVCETANAK